MKQFSRVLLLGLTVSIFSCAKSRRSMQAVQPKLTSEDAKLDASLQNFTASDEALSYLKVELQRRIELEYQMNLQLIQGPRGPILFNEPGGNPDSGAMPEMMMGKMNNADADSSSNFTTTNNQVDSVEESDFVKNTGIHLYQIVGQHLKISQITPAGSMKRLQDIKLEGNPRELLLDPVNNKIIVLGEAVYTSYLENPSGATFKRMAFMPSPSKGTVSVFSITDKVSQALSLDATFTFSGRIQTSRRNGDLIRIVTSMETNMFFLSGNWFPYEEYSNLHAMNTAQRIEYLEKQRQAKLANAEQMKLEDFISDSAFLKTDKSGSQTVPTQYIVPKGQFEGGTTHIVSLNLKSLAAKVLTIFDRNSAVYMSEQSLYLVTPYWRTPGLVAKNQVAMDYSFLHKFDVTAEDAVYVGSGIVAGHPVNQFALDEYQGNLRIATTYMNETAEAVSPPAPVQEIAVVDPAVRMQQPNRFNIITVLKPETVEGQGAHLTEIGRTENLAAGETIYSARFRGRWGYMVTFRQVDPLFVVDLADPNAPRVSGELKIPGFSNYIHFVDDDHLLTIGQDASQEGRVLGLKISLFDVTDKTAPKEQAKISFKGEGAQSEANYDHKAFTFFATKGLLAIPVSTYGYGQASSRLSIFKIAAGKIEHQGDINAMEPSSGWTSEEPTDNGPYMGGGTNIIRRSIFIDDIVYAISDVGIQAAQAASYSQVIGRLQN